MKVPEVAKKNFFFFLEKFAHLKFAVIFSTYSNDRYFGREQDNLSSAYLKPLLFSSNKKKYFRNVISF